MSMSERLQAMELLWRSFSGSEDEVPSPDWHGEVLSERLAKIESRLEKNQIRRNGRRSSFGVVIFMG
jgi:hypothetical protein